MACPFFMPTQKLENGAWPHPGRLPLGGGWAGYCTAPGHAGEVPESDTIQQSCNLGYAASCARIPQQRPWDSVRFALRSARNFEPPTSTRAIHIQYLCERAHRPVEHGRLSFDPVAGWLQRHPDARIQKMAECFLESCQAKKALSLPDKIAS